MTRTPCAAASIGLLLWLCALAPPAAAHPLDPALLEMSESANGVVDVVWRLPAARAADSPLQLILPEGCGNRSAVSVGESGPRVTERWRMECGAGGLVGRRLGIDGLRERRTDALVRIHLRDGRLIQAVLRGDSPFLTIAPRAGSLPVVCNYLRMGFEHILTGPDHLLFVLGLVLLVRGRRLLLWTITAFTAGHSVTLSLAALGFVHVAPAPVEALIAFTIFIVAVELTRGARPQPSAIQRYPWVMAFTFGLLHGLGFAGALAQVGLPTGEIPLALLSFNIGIECGQLLFVALVLAGRFAAYALPVRWPQSLRSIPAYTIGSLAVFWMLQRMAAIFGAAPPA